ncbi:protein translocase subunit SecF [Ornithinimicrobium tianjinense]|uniref:Protein-export membrane protein SecF n=1 Tax=Ornithinimicrobium tianjinense TaxID=1195761 RepID=A0A917F3K7_9MICO|nr:protein translocase subunit SecF [Ornithinimicrobium tianjinense]GGF46824.1 protein-export membrane protein SecF [Ornithinimicrobium tianjinense]
MSRFSQFGNDLYTGKRSIDVVGRRGLWYVVSAVLIAVSLLGLFARGLNFGIEFSGGTELRVLGVTQMDDYETRAREVVDSAVSGETTEVTRIGDDTVRVQTGEMSATEAEQLRSDLSAEFDVPVESVTSSLVGPSWGQSVTQRALVALGVFLLLVTVVLTLYFRTWKMAVAALVALVHDVLFTVGVYALLGIEVSPASVIGFLTILGYSIYDTIVVFDKVRENTERALDTHERTYAEAANLAVNQTFVRSINTSVVALLPVLVILVVGVTLIGPGTLVDLAWALAIGIAVGTFSSIFIATPLLVHLREGEPGIKKHDATVSRRRARGASRAERRAAARADLVTEPEPEVETGSEAEAGAAAAAAAEQTSRVLTSSQPASSPGAAPAVPGRPLHPYAQRGPRNQPRRKRRS